MRGRRKRAIIRKTVNTVILLCLLGIAVIAGVKLYHMYVEYSSNRNAYKEIAGRVNDTNDDALNVDFDELRKINPDVVGWIRYKGTPIDYPIVQGKDNSRYLYARFDGGYSDFGTLFADSVTEEPFRQFNTIVYGHHMKDGSMFGSLKKLRDPDFRRKHPKMELATPDGNYDLEIYAFLNQPSDCMVFTNNVTDDEDKDAYIGWISRKAVYTTDADITKEDQLVVLSTCAYEYNGARYIVVCRMIPK
ncbi:MAG: class B sortase [Mogibacterium sp.]|nr:class B sortase [Mogibacterium sp.]MBR0380226.1 class B sortase [Mogibacterium sp.]